MRKIEQEQYDPSVSEVSWQDFWRENHIYDFDETDTETPVYSIDTPPPTISGDIHIGHIFSYTQAEIIARYRRMKGENVFYPFGFDDNGLPTEKLVEKIMKRKGSEMNRNEYIDACLRITEEYRQKFKQLFQRMGFSADWRYTYSTMSPEAQKISQKSFLELLENGNIEKVEYPGLFCTECNTSIAQAEVERKEVDTQFTHIKFKLENNEDLLISTTRPELLPACVAVFVHPNDEKYQHLIGSKVTTPLGTTVPIIADDKVQQDKGSGAVMCCTYGDETDLYWVKKYGLPEKIIIDKTGSIQNDLGEPEERELMLSVKEYRKRIVRILEEKKAIDSIDDISHSVGAHERCGTPIEILPIEQWVVRITDMKQELLDLAEKINWNPPYMKTRYINWVENLNWEWSISRQRKFGIPIPIWYSKKTGEVITPSIDALPVNPLEDSPTNLPEGHTLEDIEPETDVLDTWATSSLTPQINARWGEKNDISDKILPMNMRPQAHDIIRTWTLYTIVKSWLHRGEIPWETLMISGHVQAKKNEKISKSKGNEKVTPAELIAKYSADGVRYWTTGAALGKDIILDESEMINGKKLTTKIFNASKFVSMGLENFSPRNEKVNYDDRELLDKWIIQRLSEVSEEVIRAFEALNLNKAREVFESFFYNDFCGNYLEVIKKRIYASVEGDEDAKQKRKSAQTSLYETLYGSLRLIAPILPHITEEIYQILYREDEGVVSIHSAPIVDDSIRDMKRSREIEKTANLFFEVVQQIRKYKSERKIRLGAEINEIRVKCSVGEKELLEKCVFDLKGITKAQKITFLEGETLAIDIQE